MNVKDFTYLLQKPNKAISVAETKQLEDILEEFPYFQAARAVHLKGLKNLNSFKYNSTLKITAAYTTDRDILFDFITSTAFSQNEIADSLSQKTPIAAAVEINPSAISIQEQNETILDQTTNTALPISITDANTILDPDIFEVKTEQKGSEEIEETAAAEEHQEEEHQEEEHQEEEHKEKQQPPQPVQLAKQNTIAEDITEKNKKTGEKELELGAPLPFTKQEKYSFAEWLTLATQKPIDRQSENQPLEDKALKDQQTENQTRATPSLENSHSAALASKDDQPAEEDQKIETKLDSEKEVRKQKKFDLIDKFISESPKIIPKEKTTLKIETKQSSKFDDKELMTETLAKVYLEQKKYKKATQAYRILSLKYPEKSGFFADRIKAVEKIQQENS